MCGCCSVAASAISRLNRSTETCADHLGGKHLHHDLAAERASPCATNTRDMPPPPSSRSTV